MSIEMLPVNRDTGEIFTVTPEMIKSLDNNDISYFLSNLKVMDKLKKITEKEVKVRLDKGEQLARLSYGDTIYQRNLVMDNEAKKALVQKYGYEAVEPLSITKLEKMYGEKIYKDLEPFIVEKPKAKAIQWDK